MHIKGNVKGNSLFCQKCDLAQPKINLINCINCGHDLGAPNVNVVCTEIEWNALQKRYADAKQYAYTNGNTIALDNFENYFTQNVNTVINISLDDLYEWLIRSGYNYKSYHRLVDEGIRTIANDIDDRKRVQVDGRFFGSYIKDIIFAALTLNNRGLFSYGQCMVSIKETSINTRASVLEENSYNFVIKHHLNLETVEIPLGYRSTWEDKLKIASAKLHKQINSTCTNNDFCKLVLFSEGNKNTDEYIEVPIYKELTTFTVKSVFVPKPKNKKDISQINEIERKYPGQVFAI